MRFLTERRSPREEDEMCRAVSYTIVIAVLACTLTAPALAEPTPPGQTGADTTMQAPHKPVPLTGEMAALEKGTCAPWSASWDVTFASKYLFEGLDYSAGKPVLQPEVVWGYRGFSATVWANHDLDLAQTNEFDFAVQYAKDFKTWSWNAGYTYLRYPHRAGWTPSQEVVGGVSWNGLLSPSLSVHYDFDAGKGGYGILGLSRTWETSPVPITLGVEGYYHYRYYGVNGCPSVAFKGETSRDIGPITFTPSVSYYATRPNRDFRGEAGVPSSWLFSLNVSQGW
jgi:hypothetical protein